jgi:hypothetical protein
MTMPASGTISMSQINTELGRASTTSISLDTAENGGYGAINQASGSKPSASNPAALSEWYSYNHNASSQINVSYDITFAPFGGLANITENGVRIIRTSSNAAGTFSSVTGDVVVASITSPAGGTVRYAEVSVYVNGVFLGSNVGTTSASYTFTIGQGNVSYYQIFMTANNNQ